MAFVVVVVIVSSSLYALLLMVISLCAYFLRSFHTGNSFKGILWPFFLNSHSKMTFQIIAAVVLLLCSGITAFTTTLSSTCSVYSRSLKLDAVTPNNNNEHNIIQRRTLLTNIASSTLLFLPNISNAESIPSVTSSEFDIILKDSAKSVLAVELSGPKSETALVKLVE